MTKFKEDQAVRVLDNAFEGTDNPSDLEVRGKTGVVEYVLEETLGPDWKGCYEVYIADLQDTYSLNEYEIEAAQ